MKVCQLYEGRLNLSESSPSLRAQRINLKLNYYIFIFECPTKMKKIFVDGIREYRVTGFRAHSELMC